MDRIVIVTKATRLKELVLEHHTEGAARFALESRGESIDVYVKEDAVYRDALDKVRQQIPSDVPVATVRRENLPNFLFRDSDLVLVCGPDGLFANTAKYLSKQPVLTINPDPRTVTGALMLFSPSNTGEMIKRVQNGEHRVEKLPFIKATIDDDRVVWGINDVFIGRKDHVSARYELSFEEKKEHQSSSGIIVSTGVGSTGWIRSVVAMMNGIGLGGRSNKLQTLPSATSDELVFVVREPFPSPNTGVEIVTGRVVPGDPLIAVSEMPSGGYIFSDGVVEKALEWKAGSKVAVSVGDRYVERIVY